MLTKNIIDRLEALERDNTLLKSQLRAISKGGVKGAISEEDILKLLYAKIDLKFINKLYRK